MTQAGEKALIEAWQIRERITRHLKFNQAEGYQPYEWQERYHACLDANDNICSQIMLLAANQSGKSLGGAMDDSFHLTGRYPEWWKPGWKRFDRPIKAVAGGQNAVSLRDTLMSKLLGEMVDQSSWGTGAIPKDCLPPRDSCSRWAGIPDAVAAVTVKHHTKGVYDGDSILFFKSYDQDKKAWMGTGIDLNHLDEEPPQDHYSQALRSTIATRGLTKLTMTPENGMTEVVQNFVQNLQAGQLLITATWDDAAHLDDATKKQLLAAMPPHEREMRSRGIPMLGSGAVFPVSEELIKIKSFPIPEHWRRIAGMDFGNNHGQAVVWQAEDPEAHVVYVYDCYKRVDPSHAVHAAAIKGRGDWIPVAWPHDGMRRDGYAGIGLAEIYRKPPLGVNMLRTHFKNPDGTNAREPGVQALLTAIQAGQYKVFSHLEDWFKEYRMYHRKDGMIVTINDDLMSASRYAYMSRRFARTPDFGDTRPSEAVPGTHDYDPFAEAR